MSVYRHIATLHERDVFPGRQEVGCLFVDRPTGKAVILREDGKIALVGTNVNHLYTLPGGGIEPEESIEEGILREVKEETGCLASFVAPLGMIDDFRNRDGKHNITSCAVVKVIDAHDAHRDLTEDEAHNGLHVRWVTPDEAFAILSDECERVKRGEIHFYNTAFNIVRDRLFLDWAIVVGHLRIDS